MGGMSTVGSDAFARGWMDGYGAGRDDESDGLPLREPPDDALHLIRPGDKVLVRMPRDTRPEQALHVAERLRERMPDVEVLVLAGVDGIDVYRPEDIARAKRGGVFHLGEAGGPDGGERTGAEGPGEAAAP
jgi:hypothetical protein